MDYLIKVNVYVKQDDVVFLKNINPEDVERKIEKFVNQKTDSKTTSAMVRFIPCIAGYNSMDIDFFDYDEDEDDYDEDEEDDEDDYETFSWIKDVELEKFFMNLLPIKLKGIVYIDRDECMYSSDIFK